MTSLHEIAVNFKARARAREVMHGTFIKTPTSHATEILAELGFDFVVIDAEHAPFDRGDIDRAVVAARAAGIPALVRVPDVGGIQTVLDSGAAGVLVPHLSSVEKALRAVAACRHRDGTRGFCNTARAGRWGARGIAQHVGESDDAVMVVGMLEDPEAVDIASDIAATPGLDALFLGRGDLSAALGEADMDAPRLRAIGETVAAACRAKGKVLSVLASTPDDAHRYRTLGASLILLSSDQGFMRQAAKAALDAHRDLV